MAEKNERLSDASGTDQAQTRPLLFDLLWKDAAKDLGAQKKDTAEPGKTAADSLPELSFFSADKFAQRSGASELKKACADLEAAAEKQISSPQRRQQFDADLDKMFARVSSGKTSEREALATLAQVSKLLNAGHGFISRPNRIRAAEGIVYHAADPDTIAQGKHGTCPVAAAEHKFYVQNPALASEMTASIALNGKWQEPGKDGKEITVDRRSLEPGAEEKVFPPKDGKRSYASQIFQITALNEVGQHLSEPRKFLQRAPHDADPGADLPGHPKCAESSKDGEYWLFSSGTIVPLHTPWSKSSNVKGLPSWLTAGFITRLNGEENCLIRSDRFRYTHESANKPGDIPMDEKSLPHIKDDNMLYVSSAADLGNKLQALKSAARLPVLVSVKAGAGEVHLSEEEKGNHIVSIDDYRPASADKPAQVLIHNQWKESFNGWMPINEFYKGRN